MRFGVEVGRDMDEEKGLWSARVDETHDREGLQALDRHLAAMPQENGAWTRALRFKIGHKLALIRKRQSARPGEAFAAPYGLPAPDERWLYQYRVADEAFQRLEHELARKGGYDALELGYTPGLFVLWAAEWFRRRYAGGGHCWEALAQALGLATDQGRLRHITQKGLGQWGRPVIRTEHARAYLSSLAREGGFPTAAVQEGGKGWARTVLAGIVAPLLAEPAAQDERARELAERQRPHLPRLFQDEEFVQLCADLGLAIVRLRRETEGLAAAAGIPVLAWLKLHRPAWAEALPLTTDERAAEALIEDLMQVEAVATGAAGAERLLVRDPVKGWCEAVRITLDGAMDSASMRAIQSREGRLRAFSAGEMARWLPGDLAMIEPPAQGESSWTARATKRGKGVRLMPFSAAVDIDLRSGEQRVARITLPGGKPRRGQLLVAVVDEGSDEAPAMLRIVGAGSGQYRAACVYIRIPADWRIAATAGETVTPLGSGAGDTRLWQVTGGAFVTDPDGDRYRIRCGQLADCPSRIDLIGQQPSWASVRGDVDLYLGPPLAQPSRPEGSLCIRDIGAKAWRAAPRPLPIGHYDLGWRADSILLDRRRIAVLPASAEVKRSGMGGDLRYEVSGFAPATITPASEAPVASSSDGGRWTSRPASEAVHRFDASISWPGSAPLMVSIERPCAASVARWNGRILQNRTPISLGDLRELVAVDRGLMQLVGELRDPHTRQTAEMTWEFYQELPLSSIEPDIASLLLPASIDAQVRLGMHDGIETYWHVTQFPLRLQPEGRGLVATKAIVSPGVELCGRAFADPAVEVRFGDYSLLTDSNHRPFMLPPETGGTWLFYLRSGETVLSRPLVFLTGGTPDQPATALARAMSHPPRQGLDEALRAVFDAACGEDEPAESIIADLIALAASLRGLPPATFRAFELLAGRPDVLTRMAMAAGPDQREAVLALSDALPFAWCTVPHSCWQESQRLAFGRALLLLQGLGSDAPRYAKETVDRTVAALVQREPLLGPVLVQSKDIGSIREIAQAFLNRAVDRVHGHRSRYRDSVGHRLPSYFLNLPDHCLETLDAPCAAALAARGEWVPAADDIRHMKAVARNFPVFFTDAFAASFKE